MRARQVVVLRLTTRPNLDLFFTMQYGTPILRQRAGKNTTIYRIRKKDYQLSSTLKKKRMNSVLQPNLLLRNKVSHHESTEDRWRYLLSNSRIAWKEIYCHWFVTTNLNRINIVSNNDKLSLFLFNKRGDSVGTMSDDRRPLRWGIWSGFGLFLCPLTQPGLLLLLWFRPILIQ